MTQVLKKPSGYRVLGRNESKSKLLREIYPLASQDLSPITFPQMPTSHTPRGKKLVDDTRLSFIKVSDPKREPVSEIKAEVSPQAQRVYAEEFFIQTISPRPK